MIKHGKPLFDFYKDVDFSHGQLLPARSPIWDFFDYRQALNGLYVGADGFPLPPDFQAIQRQAAADVASLSMFGGPAESIKALGLLESVAKGGRAFSLVLEQKRELLSKVIKRLDKQEQGETCKI